VHLELSELLACPRCGPGQGLVVSVDRIEDRRVREGLLACPGCDARYSIGEGGIDFGAAADGGPGAGVADTRDGPASGESGTRSGPEGRGDHTRAGPREVGAPAPDPEDAVRVAALLGLQEGGGAILLGAGLGRAAPRVAELAGGVEVLALYGAPDGAAAPRVTRLLGVRAGALPLRGGRLRGAALLGGSPDGLAEATRAVRPGGRVAVLRPRPELDVPGGLPLRVLAAEAAAVVAERTTEGPGA